VDIIWTRKIFEERIGTSFGRNAGIARGSIELLSVRRGQEENDVGSELEPRQFCQR
jgi:hypothetical protein